MTTRPKFQKRHYQEIASAIRSTRALPHDTAHEAMADLIEDLISRFTQDNPEFNAATFRAASDQEAGR